MNCAGQVTCDVHYLEVSFSFCLQLGLEILAFPCNQFAGQEPDSDEQIVEFACTRFKAEYPIFRKVENFFFSVCMCVCV